MKDIEPLLAQLKAHWGQQGLESSVPATDSEITAFEAHYEVVLGNEMRAYFRILNGTSGGRQGRWDAQHIMFWTLAQVRSLAEENGIRAGKNLFVFADWSLWTHAYAFSLGPDGEKSTILLVGGRTPRRLASSLADFIRGYLAEDPKVLFGYGRRGAQLARRQSA